MTTVALIALIGFLVLVLASILVDGFLKLARVRADAALPRRPELRYSRDELELAIAAAIGRTTTLRRRALEEAEEVGLELELVEHVAAGVLEDLDAGNLGGVPSLGARA